MGALPDAPMPGRQRAGRNALCPLLSGDRGAECNPPACDPGWRGRSSAIHAACALATATKRPQENDMIRTLKFAALVALAAVPASTAFGQAPAAPPLLAGTRLDLVATGEVTRVPDTAIISAGVVTTAPTASAALEQNAQRMEAVRAALRRAGIADRDIQTSSINLFPDYRQGGNEPNPQIIGYRASNELSIRFRDIKGAGRILDALVAQGANQINGPNLIVGDPQPALDEARTRALAAARTRAELYARALGKRVGRILSISEAGAMQPMPMIGYAAAMERSSTKVEAGEQTLSVSLSVSFELE
jgi:uncharacterized protein YggE